MPHNIKIIFYTRNIYLLYFFLSCVFAGIKFVCFYFLGDFVPFAFFQILDSRFPIDPDRELSCDILRGI